jgi:hypothetical protein
MSSPATPFFAPAAGARISILPKVALWISLLSHAVPENPFGRECSVWKTARFRWWILGFRTIHPYRPPTEENHFIHDGGPPGDSERLS